ncbi:hypothetical protein WJX73_004803 [Symbiochloris irregularis]|uniref:Glycosyltransferase 61 catalytic domain-containing protein n=1 Tax=Symbiochloris irregularis TaxID=706552 RepID=A0AAW1Q2L1_9CHLO
MLLSPRACLGACAILSCLVARPCSAQSEPLDLWQAPKLSEIGAGSTPLWPSAATLQELSLADSGKNAGSRPQHSSVEIHTEDSSGFAVFHNVLMRSEHELLFYVADEEQAKSAKAAMPDMDKVLMSQYWNRADAWGSNEKLGSTVKITIMTPHQHAHIPDLCSQWVEHPAVWYSGSSLDHLNVFHLFFDNLVPIIGLVWRQGWLDLDAYAKRTHVPTSAEAKLVIMQRQPWALTSNFNWLLDQLTPDHGISDRMVGSCFRTLMLGMDVNSKMYERSLSDQKARNKRAGGAAFQAFAVEAVRRTHAQRGWHPLKLFKRGEGDRLRIGWVSRPRKHIQSRAVINEDQVLEALRRRSDADVSVLRFRAQNLGRAIEEVHGLDILMGVHGAGMSNSIWLQPGAVVIQLIPYGWHSTDHNFFKLGVIFEEIAKTAGAHYLQWVNRDPKAAFFLPGDFHEGDPKHVLHPDQTTPLPRDKWLNGTHERWWMFQDTMVDVPSLMNVVDEAVRLVKGRGSTAGRR